MELQLFFKPIEIPPYLPHEMLRKGDTLRACVVAAHKATRWEALADYDMLCFGIPSVNSEAQAPENIRNQLYKLARINPLRILDLGDLHISSSTGSALKALEMALPQVLEARKPIVIFGGGKELGHTIMQSMGRRNPSLNACMVSPRLDISAAQEQFCSANYLAYAIAECSEALFNITNVGFQNYYNSPSDVEFYNDLLFDTVRLGSAQGNLAALEPVFRDSHFVSVDMAVIRQSDAPAHPAPSPNGFFGQELCQLARYAGLSDTAEVFGLFDMHADFDRQHQSAGLAAQIIWHFLEGFSQRQKDYPARALDEYTKFIVQLDDVGGELVFYKNKANSRWWMEVVYKVQQSTQKKIVSCNETDYHTASRNEIPDLWWRTLQKIKRRLN